ncbi:fuconate dehydratase [Micrococcales bacterium 31B]|nr:fuconate dehydratase [Micrococcales bacterium 31B]
MATVTALHALDIRFPTSRELDGSDAMNPDPDYSAAYVRLETDATTGASEPPAETLTGHGFAFTIGRGNDVQTAAIKALTPHLVGRDVDEICDNLGAVYHDLMNDSQLRWLGPEKGVMHMAIGAVVNAVWDLASRRAGTPLWRFIAEMSPEALADTLDYRYLSDVFTRDDVVARLRALEPTRGERIATLEREGYPAYTTSPGWLGYSDEKLVRLCREAVEAGFKTIKLKVGADVDEDVRRVALARETVGPEIHLAVDANQRWDVASAIEWMSRLEGHQLAWIEEPTSPDDVLGHAAIRRGIETPVSTGEHTQNRVIFKQLFQAEAVDLIQIDAARVGGVNENLTIMLLAAHFGVRVFPHAGGVGLCELVQHIAMADYVSISGVKDDRAIEFVDHLHEHFATPTVIRDGNYLPPQAPGFSAEIHPQTLSDYAFPQGSVWSTTA